MELSEITLTYLRDEAYADLAREGLLAKLDSIEQARAEVVSTRPPFGVLGSRETRETFARSMRSVEADEARLRDHLMQITGIAEWLRPRIRSDVSSYLASVSPDYCQLLQVAARLDDWEQSYRAVPELLTAFARDLRALRTALLAGKKTSSTYELAILRESAERLSRQRHELGIIEQAALALVPAALAGQIVFPEPPNLLWLSWVSRLAVITADMSLAEVMRVEPEIRALVEGAGDPVLAKLQATRARCNQAVNHTLEEYWTQLREHARTHYVEEREPADVIAMLTEHYIDADIQQRQQAVSVASIPTR